MHAWKRSAAKSLMARGLPGLMLRTCMALALAACAQERPTAKGLLQVSAQPVAQVAATSGEQALAIAQAQGGGANTWNSATNRPLEFALSQEAYTFRDTVNQASSASARPVTLSAVPLHALARATGEWQFTVHVVEEKNGRAYAQARTVTVAQVAGDMVTILSGVRPGELVITSGTTLACDGQEIRYTRN